nr:MAG TPA: hypothetical protein [Caudoviricetes sp.]
MLKLKIMGRQYWDPAKEEFFRTPDTELRLEHSLLSLAKWESNWHVPFLSNAEKMTKEQLIDYLRCMTVGKDEPPELYTRLTREDYKAINEYMADPMTATWFRGEAKPSEWKPGDVTKPKLRGRRIGTDTTAELIYAQMFTLGIPKEFETWHLNRLLTLIRVCQEHAAPPKKMSRGDRMTQQRMLNEQRRAKLHTRG